MTHINPNYLKLQEGYLFAAIKKIVDKYKAANPGADIISLGIGDVTLPLTAAVRAAMHRAVDEMGAEDTFRGYGPEQGYLFLREAIARREYRDRGIGISEDEIFVSDGSKCDVGNIQEIFSNSCRVAIADPVYPVYLESNIMAGRAGELDREGHFDNIIYMPSVAENGFLPSIPSERADLVYLCSPNNPTGAAFTAPQLEEWVKYAATNGSVILYDSAYSDYVRDPSIPKSIYEIAGAENVAIEFKSFSKKAGFTGVRCAFAVVPRKLAALGPGGEKVSLSGLWNRRQSTKFNGVPYIVQRGAEAVYSHDGRKETAALIDYYMENARIILNGLKGAGFEVYGGENAPYIWWKLPEGIKSADFFILLLEKCHVVGTPGAGFGPAGEGYFRLTAFGNRQKTAEAVRRISERSGELVSIKRL